MFSPSLTNEQFVSAVKRMPWDVLEGSPVFMVCADAIRRGVEAEKLPAFLHDQYRSLAQQERDQGAESFDPTKWLAERFQRLNFEQLLLAISYVTHLVGHPAEYDEELLQWSWCDSPDDDEQWCHVAITEYGLFWNNALSHQRSGYALIGYCLSHEIGWWCESMCGRAGQEPDKDKVATAVAEAEAHKAKGLKLV